VWGGAPTSAADAPSTWARRSGWAFGIPGKADAIDRIWRDRARLYGAYLAAADKLAALDELPWIGPVTKRALARSLGLSDGQADRRSEPLKAAA
jgi:hypothetical protein